MDYESMLISSMEIVLKQAEIIRTLLLFTGELTIICNINNVPGPSEQSKERLHKSYELFQEIGPLKDKLFEEVTKDQRFKDLFEKNG